MHAPQYGIVRAPSQGAAEWAPMPPEIRAKWAELRAEFTQRAKASRAAWNAAGWKRVAA